MFRLRKAITLEAAHRLPNHRGKCRRFHGHSYKVEAFVVGEHLVPTEHSFDDEGMLIDFGVLSGILKKLDTLLDHTYLNDATLLAGAVPTAEFLAQRVYAFVKAELDDTGVAGDRGLRLERIRVWETADSYAEYEEPEA